MKATRPARSRTDPVRRARLPLAVLAALICAAPAVARPGYPNATALEATVASRFATDGAATAIVHVTLAYRHLVFKRDGDGFASTLRVSVVAEARGRRVGGGFASVSAAASDYGATRSEERLRCVVDVPLSVREEVVLRLRATVAGTSRTWERDLPFDPSAAGAVPFHFTGFHWDLGPDAQGETVMGAGRDTLSAVFTLATHAVRADTSPRAELQVLVRNARGQERILRRNTLTRASGDSLVERVTVTASEMPFGALVFTALVVADDGASLELTPGRDLVNLALPWEDEAAWRRHVSWLEMIVDADRRRTLAGTSAAGREAAWRAVWAERPSGTRPGEREHLLRIVEADHRFGRFGRGALSDRGRILIYHGDPDRVETLGMDAAYPGTWQIWYYGGPGLLFRFYDAYGLGDFRLYDTAPY